MGEKPPWSPPLSEVIQARSRLGVACRVHRDDPEKITDARRELAVAKIAEYVARTVAEAPPLSPAQRDRLAILLRSGTA